MMMRRVVWCDRMGDETRRVVCGDRMGDDTRRVICDVTGWGDDDETCGVWCDRMETNFMGMWCNTDVIFDQ